MQNSDISASLQITEAFNNQLQLSGHHILVDRSESFEIQQNNNHAQIQSFLKNEQEQDDFLNYSLDQKSISFIMEENVVIPNQLQTIKQNQILAISNIDLNTQADSSKAQTKKKRREIFDKYKKVSVQNVLFQSNTNPNQFMDTFDQIFKLKSPEKQQKQTASTVTAIRPIHSHPIIKQFRSKNAQQQNSSIFKKKENVTSPITTGERILSGQNNFTKQFRDIPNGHNVKQVQKQQSQSPQKKYNVDELHFSMEQRLSIILPSNNPNQVSKDDADLQNILHSQIFNSQTLHYTINNHNQNSYNNIQISAMNPSMMIASNRQQPQNTLAFDQISSRMLIRQKSQNTLPTIGMGDLLSRNLSQQRLKITKNQQQKILIKQAQHIKAILGQQPEAYKQKRVPKFLREIRQSNTLLPNFSFKKNITQVYDKAHSHLKQLIILIKKALDLLNGINSAIKNKKIKVTKAIAILINEHSLQTFLNSRWEQYQLSTIQGIQQIRPNQNFVRRVYNFEKIQNALNNYLKIADYYMNIKLNFQDQRSIKKYYDIRLKFWEIQRNIKLISEDLYSESIQRVIPKHYYEQQKTKNYRMQHSIKEINFGQIQLSEGGTGPFDTFLHWQKCKEKSINLAIQNVNILSRGQKILKYLSDFKTQW